MDIDEQLAAFNADVAEIRDLLLDLNEQYSELAQQIYEERIARADRRLGPEYEQAVFRVYTEINCIGERRGGRVTLPDELVLPPARGR